MTFPRDSESKGLSSQVFMLRFWSEDMSDGWIDWRGRVQHVNSGEVTYFHNRFILENFINEFLGGFPTVELHEEGKNYPTWKPPAKQS
jgi:hypothetical protein